MNIKLELQYDGTNYHGWQTQPRDVTVQSTLTRAIAEVTAQRVKVTGCGRTDSGVHALKYIANFICDTTIPLDKLPLALNAHLPPDIVIHRAEEAAEDFRAGDSVRKTYIYKILNTKMPDAFLRNYSWHFKYDLDISKMQEAAKAFLGEHDFIGFASSGFSVKTTVRTIYSLDVRKNHDIIEIEVSSNGFLYNMVRIIAGTLVNMGNGSIDYRSAADIIASHDRRQAGITAPPQGLFLKEVFY